MFGAKIYQGKLLSGSYSTKRLGRNEGWGEAV